jgi:hypothetical protein
MLCQNFHPFRETHKIPIDLWILQHRCVHLCAFCWLLLHIKNAPWTTNVSFAKGRTAAMKNVSRAFCSIPIYEDIIFVRSVSDGVCPAMEEKHRKSLAIWCELAYIAE